MWSDTLLAAERIHLIRLALWAAASASLGTAVVAILALRRVNAPVVWWFGLQTLAWGTAELLFAAARWRALAMRDVSAATRLDRLTWFASGLDVGVIVVGVATAVLAWRFGRHAGALGGGLAIVVQGLALLVIELTFAATLARLV